MAMTQTTHSPSIIDLSRVTAPDAIEALNFEALNGAFVARFKAVWESAREADPSLPAYDVELLETDPAMIVGQALSYLRLLDRARVNDAVKAVLAPLASGSNLDAIAARQNVQRLTIRPATDQTPALMESDDALRRRYLLSFDGRSAGSMNRYLYEAWTVWPEMLDARVNGRAIHGRRGDTDVVIIGPNGDKAPADKKALVASAVKAPNVQPEAVGVAVLDAGRAVYSVRLVLEIPPGPDASLVTAEAAERVWAAARSRMLIGGEIPAGFLAGAAYGPSIIAVRDLAPVAIAADPYTVPVPTSISIEADVRS